MRIGIDCRMWNETGIGRYIRNIVGELSTMDNRNTYVLFLMDAEYDTVTFPSNFVKVKANIKWHTFGEQLLLPYVFYKEKLDLLYVPHFNAPIFYLKKLAITIHDLTILHTMTGRATTLPYPIYFLKHLAFRLVLYLTIKRARSIFAVTEYVRQDIVKTYNVDPGKIIITVNAVDSTFKRVMLGDLLPAFQKYGLQQPYLFYVGNAHPHKNLERLIEAFSKLVSFDEVKKSWPGLTLVLGGNKNFFYKRLEKEWSEKNISQRLRYIGFVDDEDLPALYSGAEVFVNPSMYEGFGIQILEAYACGTKVACSNTSSLPEVAGNGAFLFDPYDTDHIAKMILATLEDNSGVNIEYGYKRITEFSWNDSARRVLKELTK